MQNIAHCIKLHLFFLFFSEKEQKQLYIICFAKRKYFQHLSLVHKPYANSENLYEYQVFIFRFSLAQIENVHKWHGNPATVHMD